MLKQRTAVFALLATVLILFLETPVSAQCGSGKTPFEVQGYASILIDDHAYGGSTGSNALGVPDGNAAYFSNNGQYIIVDLSDTVWAGQTYSFFWRQHQSMFGSAIIWWSESLDGTTFFNHPQSGILSTSTKSFFSTQITAATDTRYLRIYMGSGTNDFFIDAILYNTTKCYSNTCGTGYTAMILSGNALPLSASDQNGVIDYANISGSPDGRYARFENSGAWAILNLPFTIPAGQQYGLVWRPVDDTGVASTTMSVEESDGTSWGPAKPLAPYFGESPVFITETVTASQNTNRIRVRLQAGSDHFHLDGLVFNALTCLPPPPVLSVSGNYEYCGSQTLIAPELTVTDPADQIIDAAYVQIGTGFQADQDILEITPASGISQTYIPAFGLLILKGPATASQFQSVLRTLTYSNSNPNPVTGNREIIVSFERYYPSTGHYYRYVPTTRLRWHEARLNADRAHLFGMQGYLVTIGSAGENEFLRSQMAGGAVWIGASDFYSAEGDWKWVTGPEAGTSFWLGDENGTLLPSAYANWDDGEPNNDNDQDFCHFLTDGTWDDNGYGIGSGIWRPDGFYVEFGGMPGDPLLNIHGTVNINVITGQPPSPVITGPATVCPGATGVEYSTPNVPGHNYFWEVTGGTITSGQGTNSITVDWGITSPGIVRVTESIGGSCQVTTADYTVFIGDTTPPVITGVIPATTLEGCDVSAAPAAVTTVSALEALGVSVSDVCTPDGSLVVTSSDSPSGSCPIVITRTYRVTDVCGNWSEVTHTINIDDTTAPTFTAPPDITICRDINGNYDRDTTNTGVVYDENDNCDTSLDAIYTDSDVNMGTVDAVGYITRTWTLTDNCGNETVKYQTIWVQPVPRISVTVPDTLFCNGSTVEFAIDSLVVSKGEVMYDLDVTYPAGVPGTLTDGQRQIADISDHLVNSTDSYQTVTYHFRPYIQGKPGDPTCNEGVEVIIAIHVEPTARVDLTLTDDELCNGENVNIELSTVTTPYSGIEFNVSALNDYPEITGYTDRTGLALADLINEPLSNSGDTARLVTYVVSPVTLDVSGNQKCTGINDTVRVWVNPTPRATPVNYTPHMCYGETTDIVLLSPTVMSSGINEFNYTITSTAPTTVVAGNRDPLNSVAPGTHLQFPYTNESDTMQSVFFRITPKVTGPGCPYGPPVVSEVKVHAHPLQSLEIMDSITCDGGQDGALEILHARGIDSMWVAWTGPDYWEDAGYNMFIAEECSQGYYTATVTDSLGCVSSAWLNLLAPNTEVSFYFNPYITCPGAGDATATIALTEGNAPPYHYYLIRNYTDTVYQGSMTLGHFFNLANLSPGDYLLSVEDANGCKKELLQTLYDAPATTVKFEKSLYAEDNISCSGYHDGSIRVSKISTWYMTGSDTAFVSTRAPYSYHWTATDGGVITGNPDDSLLVDIPAGTYTLTVTDNLGCQFQFTEVMTEPDGIDLLDEDISQSPDGNYQISCHDGSDGYITLQFDGGTGAYSYEWTGPDGFTADTESLTSLGAGTYDLTVTDASLCHKSYSWTLHQPDSLSIAVNTSHTPDGAYNIGCHGDNGTIDITVTGGSGPGTYTYSWTSIEDPEWTSNLEDIDVNAGHYQLQLTDVNGCTNTRSVEMTQPEPLGLELVISEITCLNSPAYDDGAINLTVSGGKAPYTYSWTGPSGFTSSLEDISSLTEGTYSVTVTDDYGCTISTDTVLTLPEPLTIEARLSDYNGYSVSCLGRADGWIKVATLTGTAPYEYTWTGPDGFTATLTDSIYALKEGTYTVTVTDSHLCTMTQDISLASPGQLSMILSEGSSNGGSYNINCNGAATGTVIVTAVNAAGTPGYLWSDGQTGASRDNLPAGLHEVIITDANGCIADTSLTLTQPDSLRISFSIISPYCPESNDGSIFAGVTGGEGAYTFVWSDGQTTREATGLIQGLYIVEARDFNGCVIADSLQLNALNEICVGIPNAFSPDGDGINEYWNITRIAFYSEAEVIILNRWGEMVWKSERGYPEPWDGRASNGKILPMDSYHYAIDLHNGERPIVGHVTIIR